MAQQQQGDKIFAAFRQNMGGLNITDSPFVIDDSQAAGGYNYDYTQTGAIQKSLTPSAINSIANSQLRSLGLNLRNTKNSSKNIIRYAGTQIQLIDLLGNFTALTDDTSVASSSLLPGTSLQPAVSSMFVTPSTDVLWSAGGGMASIYGAYSDSKATANGVPAPTGTIVLTEQMDGTGIWAAAGVYVYGILLRKASTGAVSNVSLDTDITLASTTDSVRVDLTGLTGLDITRYDRIFLYRSALNGADGFTTGSIVVELNITSPSYTGIFVDNGDSLVDAQNVPRAGNTILDNSPLPTNTYNVLTTWKRRLVTAAGSTLQISDLNKPESWPLTNPITIPSGGAITGVAVISYTPNAVNTDEYLAIFKETELWVLSGNDFTDWSLKFVDFTGTLSQPLVVTANGFLTFIDNRGVYVWDGLGKPAYASRPIESMFGVDGTLDRSKLIYGSGVFFRRQNQVVWYLSDNNVGEQQLVLKMDLRLTLPKLQSFFRQSIVDGVFMFGKVAAPVYASSAFIFPTSSNQEQILISGDAAGFVYRQFYSTTGTGAADYDFSYITKFFDFQKPNQYKQFYQVVAWVQNLGNWPVTLDYWTDYRSSDEDKHTVPVTINTNADGTEALWDVALWDVAKWDDFALVKPTRLIFNLSGSPYNNNQGEVLRLRFRNANSDQPILLYGFGVTYADLGTRT